MSNSKRQIPILKIPLYLKIIIGMVLGIGWGFLAISQGWKEVTLDWIKPWGEIFLRLLKLIAVPLILISLIKGISGLSDISRLSHIGLKTLLFYLLTTVIAVSLGLVLVNSIKPGERFPIEIRTDLQESYSTDVTKRVEDAETQKESGSLQFVVDIVPENIFYAASDNKLMLQVVFFSVLFGIGMVLLPKDKTRTVSLFFDGLNDIILRIVEIIMRLAPYGVFALLAGLMVEVAGEDISRTGTLFSTLGLYCLTVIAGLLLLIVVIYPIFLKIFAKIGFLKFYRSIFPAQMVAFSTSSSAATLPVTMKCCEDGLGINKEISGFVLPIGATINMDGTTLYQAVAAVFIAQTMGMDLSITQQLTILLTATLASIGSAAVPGAGVVMLIIVLESIGVPSEGIAIILAVDRPLDMLRTTVNVTGDTVVASTIARMSEKKKKNT